MNEKQTNEEAVQHPWEIAFAVVCEWQYNILYIIDIFIYIITSSTKPQNSRKFKENTP